MAPWSSLASFKAEQLTSVIKGWQSIAQGHRAHTPAREQWGNMDASWSLVQLVWVARSLTRRYRRLPPPPRCQEVILPWLLRPPVLRSPSVRGLYGRPDHKFSLVVMMRPLKPAGRHHQRSSHDGRERGHDV